MIDLHIQIVNYKTKEYLIKLLQSVAHDLKDFPRTYTISILDNASGDTLSDIPELFHDLKIDMYQGEKNVGFGVGHNFLAQKIEVKYILLLNPDIEIQEEQTISRLIESFEKNNADILGPRLVTSQQQTQCYDHGELHGLFAKITFLFGGSFWKEGKSAEEVSWVSGAVFLIKKEKFDLVKGFDENFFLYKEEEDLCLRVRVLGGKVVYDPNISVFHIGSVIAKKSVYYKKSLAYFKKKYPLLRRFSLLVGKA